jgi:hypothetical protein
VAASVCLQKRAVDSVEDSARVQLQAIADGKEADAKQVQTLTKRKLVKLE